MGGFSFSKVPRPGAPLRRRRRPGRPFLGGRRIALVARHHIDLVDLDHALKLDVRSLRAQAFAQGRRHRLDVILVQIQFAGDLAVGKIEAHEIQAQNPDAERLMMAGQDRAAQIVEASAATFAAITLPVLLRVIDAVAYD